MTEERLVLAVPQQDHAAAARALEAAGDLVGAISELSAANRANRDPEVELHLVALRHQAYETLDHAAAAAPPRITASRASTGPLPALSPDALTLSTLRSGLSTHGCVLVRGLVPPARVSSLVDGIDRALAACDEGLAGAAAAQTTPWFVPFAPDPGKYRVTGRRNWVRANGAVWTADSPRMMFELLETFDDADLRSLVAAYLGERPALSANKCVLRRVPVTSNGAWHQDGAFLGEEVRSLNVWISLSHCGLDAPGLDLVPRRLDAVAPTGTDGASLDWSVSPAVVDELAQSAPVQRPVFAPGDVLLFDHLLMHRTAIDPSMTRERYAIETWFFAPSTYPSGQIPLVY